MILKGRLFWKILFGFWFTIIMISQLLWVAFSLYRHEGPPEQRMAKQLAPPQPRSGWLNMPPPIWWICDLFFSALTGCNWP